MKDNDQWERRKSLETASRRCTQQNRQYLSKLHSSFSHSKKREKKKENKLLILELFGAEEEKKERNSNLKVDKFDKVIEKFHKS